MFNQNHAQLLPCWNKYERTREINEFIISKNTRKRSEVAMVITELKKRLAKTTFTDKVYISFRYSI